jgi:hypothetical protein
MISSLLQANKTGPVRPRFFWNPQPARSTHVDGTAARRFSAEHAIIAAPGLLCAAAYFDRKLGAG